ncbi:11904_t:CDS:2 [Gigaspora margarita]|uniref:11904_t:CDS:1 n=1 Tax=Gigaspora margarita TaxID=4874 RepID=A0ABN7UNF6_GIGMA|nr:11904_t:CDS:2 [Gigaspora margarita]
MDSSIIDETIQEWQVNLYNYNEFTNIKLIDEGGFGKIEKASWERTGLIVALKSLKIEHKLDENVVKIFVKE